MHDEDSRHRTELEIELRDLLKIANPGSASGEIALEILTQLIIDEQDFLRFNPDWATALQAQLGLSDLGLRLIFAKHPSEEADQPKAAGQ